MRISDWSSDVCSSDLIDQARRVVWFGRSFAGQFLDRGLVLTGLELGIGDRQQVRIGVRRGYDDDRLRDGGARKGQGDQRQQNFLHLLYLPENSGRFSRALHKKSMFSGVCNIAVTKSDYADRKAHYKSGFSESWAVRLLVTIGMPRLSY